MIAFVRRAVVFRSRLPHKAKCLFTSFTESARKQRPVTLRVDKPRFDDPPASLYFTHGQVVTFRFLCSNQGGCSVIFDNTYAVEAGWDTVVVPIPNGMGRAISFQAEVPPPSSPIPAHYFFQLYRSDDVPNG